MIAFIKGKLISASDGVAVLETGGIGYELYVSHTALVKLPPVGKEALLYAYMNVREDGVTLFGFHSKEEKNMFLKLTSVSGIGPKVAMSMLSGMELSALALAIIAGDAKAIAKVKGVGKKIAERIILELKEKISSEECSLSLDAEAPGAKALGAAEQDAVAALCSLGISRQEAFKAVSAVSSKSKTLEELISDALKIL